MCVYGSSIWSCIYVMEICMAKSLVVLQSDSTVRFTVLEQHDVCDVLQLLVLHLL